jgi:hypothetical protein
MKYIAIINSDEPLTEHMIQEIKDTAFCGDDQTPYVFDIEKILDMAEVPRWIPVSEKLPEEGKTVMASTKYGIYPEARYSKKYGWKWPWEVGEDYWSEIVDSVEAWMPLPEPYKAEREYT